MSPEQALGKNDSRSDIFSLGSTLYELATGRPAFRGTTPMETMHKVARCECEPLAEVGPDLPEALVSVIERCMACDPKAATKPRTSWPRPASGGCERDRRDRGGRRR